MIRRAAAITLFLVACATDVLALQQEPFPHEAHARLFPVCASCHTMDGTAENRYPTPASCANCHDGTVQDPVDWAQPMGVPTLLDFSHETHNREAAADSVTCQTCHVAAGRGRMAVEQRPVVGQCLSCHAHESPEHYSGASCSTCHIQVASSDFDADRILALPLPPGHSAPDFVQSHSGSAECSTCHTRERCTTCHVNAATLPDVQAVPPAGPAVELPRWTAEYPTPTSHSTLDWLQQHGIDAAAPESCSTCHTRDGCTTCHVEVRPDAVAALPSASHVVAPGVAVERVSPASHASPSFETAHGPFAETAESSCSACHGRTECAACHDTPSNPSFHPLDFGERHAAEAFARRLECVNCHDSENFCGACHRSSGLVPSGITGAIYHDAEGAWLLRHGQAARQGLETCVTCHRPPDCLRCHSELGAFQVSPHGPDFDAERARQRNAFVCRNCHIRDPLVGTGGR